MATKEEKLEALKSKMEKDESLPLKKNSTRLVFGVGNPEAKILFIGEGPGYWEDQKGEPFVGNAGKFLDQLLHLIKLPREKVFITNVVHHRPPQNRDPLPEEMAAYGKYLDEIIKIIDPEAIVTLGRFSMGKFLPNTFISSVHGKGRKITWNEKDILVVPMYHPAAGLRNGSIRRATENDFLLLPKIYRDFRDKKEEEKKEEHSEQIKLI